MGGIQIMEASRIMPRQGLLLWVQNPEWYSFQEFFSMPKWKLKQEIKNRLPLILFLAVRTENNMTFYLWQIAPCLIIWNKCEWEVSQHLVCNLLIMAVKRELFHLEGQACSSEKLSPLLTGTENVQTLPTCGSQEAAAGAFHREGNVGTNRNPWMTPSGQQAWNCAQGFHLGVKLGIVDMGKLRKGRNLLL